MARRSANSPEPNPIWTEFAAHHPGHRHLAVNPLVALPFDALDALAKVKGLFDPADLEFEQVLTKSVVRGFFHRRPMSAWGSGPHPAYSAQQTLEEAYREMGSTSGLIGRGIGERRRIGESSEQLQLPQLLVEMREQDLADKKLPAPVGRKLEQHSNEVSDKMIQRGDAYVGWLVLRPAFRKELEGLRSAWAESVARWCRIPHPVTKEEEMLECAFFVAAFCRRWCLERLWAWEWPEPIAANLSRGRPPIPLGIEEGVTLTLPWPMLRGKQIDFHKLISNLRLERTPEHLRDWVVSDQPQRRVRSGEVHHQMIFALYRTLTLALHVRYPASRSGFVERVDEALASVLDVQEETVKRTRLELLRGLAEKTT